MHTPMYLDRVCPGTFLWDGYLTNEFVALKLKIVNVLGVEAQESAFFCDGVDCLVESSMSCCFHSWLANPDKVMPSREEFWVGIVDFLVQLSTSILLQQTSCTDVVIDY